MNETAVALLLLLGVLVVAAVSTRGVAIVASLVAFACYNFFFLPPVGAFSISKKDDVAALLVLLAVSLIGSHLSHVARRRAREALALTEERNEAEMARRSAETKAALVASLSHDLKTPLTALTIATANLSIPGLSEDERHEQTEIIQAELLRLRRLFDSVVEMASVESRSMITELEWVLPSDIVDAAVQHTGAVLAARPIERIDDVVEQLVQVDPRLASAALAHVLENAAMYSPPASPISIGVQVGAGRLAITVRDRGPGLRKEDIDRIFERSYRGIGMPENQFSSGMGLAITRGLVAIQGGIVAAANHPEGGAVFTLQIPAPARAVRDVAVDV